MIPDFNKDVPRDHPLWGEFIKHAREDLGESTMYVLYWKFFLYGAAASRRLQAEASSPRCGFVPPTYAPCTRNKGHEGPCAHPLSAGEITKPYG